MFVLFRRVVVMTGTTKILPLFDGGGLLETSSGEISRAELGTGSLTPACRPTDPETSREAAELVDTEGCEGKFLRALLKLGQATAYEVADICDHPVPESIRKRAGRLKSFGLIVCCSSGMTPNGRRCEKFQLTTLGRKVCER